MASGMQQQFQLDLKLTPEKAKKTVCQKEAVREHQALLKEGESKSDPILIETAKRKPVQRPRPSTATYKLTATSPLLQ